MLGGDFSQTAPDISDTDINQISTKNLVYWYNNNWETGFEDALESVQTTFHGSDGKIYTGGSLEYFFWRGGGNKDATHITCLFNIIPYKI